MTKYFKPAVFRFLPELEPNNEKAWWEVNKDRYIEVMREAALELINEFGDRIRRISPHFLADSRTVGGSLMRPYRDMRLPADTTPSHRLFSRLDTEQPLSSNTASMIP